jgi:hypothetical protein
MKPAEDSIEHNKKGESTQESLRPSLVQDSEIDTEYLRYASAKKRLFIGLVMGTSALVCMFLVLLWIVPYIGLKEIHPTAPWIFGVLIFTAIFIVSWAAFGLVFNIVSGKALPLFKRMRGITVRLFLPLMMLLGRTLGITKEKVWASFIKVNNELVASSGRRYRPSEILLLMPHCLQRSDCTVRLTYGVENCKRCGKCPILGLLDLSMKYGVHMDIATGGTIARRIVVQKRPKIILAVACERDLSSGIQDTYPLPVFGILNDRPFGPCLDTQVALNRLEAAMQNFLDPEFYPKTGQIESFPVESPQQLQTVNK